MEIIYAHLYMKTSMREIKFRAWNNSDKGFVYFDSPQELYLAGRSDDIGDISSHTFMQYTGLKDRNGKEIYEGDIVATYYAEKAYRKDSVEWGAYTMIICRCDDDFEIFGPYVRSEHSYREMLGGGVEIVGNIYENPELLEDED